MRHTAWTSTLPSDRIPPKAKQTGKTKQKDAGPPKSKDVVKLERLRDDLCKASGRDRDPRGGCFCQARMHALSAYNPICRSCGLILCDLNLPNFACPHCSEALLTPPTRALLLEGLETRIADTLAKEEHDRQRAIHEARTAEGAFPTLSAATSRASTPGSGSDAPQPRPVNQTHKVLSLDPKTRKVKISTPAVPRPAPRPKKDGSSKASEPEYTRVPAPLPEVPCSSPRPDAQRPWANVSGLNVTYVPPAARMA